MSEMAGKFVENYKKRFVNPYNFKIVIRDILTAE